MPFLFSKPRKERGFLYHFRGEEDNRFAKSMKKILWFFCVFLCVQSAWGQVSLEWMRASVVQRKRIESQRLQESLEMSSPQGLRPVSAQEQQADRYLGLRLHASQLSWIWNARQELLLPLPDEEGRVDNMFAVYLPAWRWARSRQLQVQTFPVLSSQASFVYRVDIKQGPWDCLQFFVYPLKNELSGKKRIKLEIFAQRLQERRYGVFVQPYLVEEEELKSERNNNQNALSAESLPAVQIGVLWR